MRRYYTGLLIPSYESLQKPLRGRGWAISTEQKLDDDIRRSIASCPEEIVIHTQNAQRAQAVLTLVLDSWSVLMHSLPSADDLVVIPEDSEERREWGCDSLLDQGQAWSASGFTLSSLIAQRASMKRKFVYAIALYHESLALHLSLDVDHMPGLFPYQHRSINPRDHVRFAYAIVIAYAVLEQLGLSLHGECFRNKAWIIEKRSELEQRLKNAGIKLNETLMWTLRGGKTKLEAERPPTIVRKCAWSCGQIRDCQIEFVDAIADLRWLRSRVAAHDVDILASKLSVHDVRNAQLVARRAILESMGFDKARILGLFKEYEDS
jgi:hypothetical protein